MLLGELVFAFHQRFGRPMTTKWREGCFPPRPAGPTLRKRSSLFQQLFAAAFRNSLSRQSFPAARLSSLSQQLFSAISHELWTRSLKEPYIAQPFCLGLNPCQKLVNIFQGKPCWLASVAENTQGGETRCSDCAPLKDWKSKADVDLVQQHFEVSTHRINQRRPKGGHGHQF